MRSIIRGVPLLLFAAFISILAIIASYRWGHHVALSRSANHPWQADEQLGDDQIGGESTLSLGKNILEEATRKAEKSVVLIESYLPGHRRRTLGAGFIVNSRGWVATNYHVLSKADYAWVENQNGERFDIAGYLAVDPQLDLAVVQLSGKNLSLPEADLARNSSPEKMSLVVALGHPLGITNSAYDGRVSRLARTSELEEASRHFLSLTLGDRDDPLWIQHTALISDGNSGGPLLDSRGKVLGINTWVNEELRLAYALDVSYLVKMLAEPLDHIVTLRQHRQERQLVAQNDKNKEPPTDEAPNRVFESFVQQQWHIKSTREYESLQGLIAQYVWAQLPADYSHGAGLSHDQIAPVADVSVAALAAADLAVGKGHEALVELANSLKQSPEEERTLAEFARPHLLEANHVVICPGRIVKIFPHSDRYDVLIEVEGLSSNIGATNVLLPADAELGTFCVISGIASGELSRFGENPFQPEHAIILLGATCTCASVD